MPLLERNTLLALFTLGYLRGNSLMVSKAYFDASSATAKMFLVCFVLFGVCSVGYIALIRLVERVVR